MDFPKMSDNSFPYIDNVNVYQVQNNFDYSQWTEDTKLTVLCVPWDRDYKNVVDFESESERDKYFKDKALFSTPFESKQWIQPDGRVKLPIPFNVLTKANYLVVEFPNAPVPMGDNSSHINKYCYFIDRIVSKAPNCSEAIITLDYWQTFITNANISYMMLEQGHAPVAAAPTPKEFLSDPIDSTKYLLEPDVNSGALNRIRQIGDYIVNHGDIFAVFAMKSDGDSKDWGTLGTESMRIPSAVAPIETGSVNWEYMAIDSKEIIRFVLDLNEKLPYLLESIVCCIYINKAYLNIVASYDMVGHTVYRVSPKTQIVELADITVDDFAYDDKYKNLTKLYTSQYSIVELVDQDGSKNEIKIENVGQDGKLQLYAALNLAGTSTAIDAHLINVSGSELNEIIYNNSNTANLKFQTSGAWADYMAHWDMPQFAVFSDQENYQSWRRWWTIEQQKKARDIAYQQSIDIAQTAKASGDASSKTSYDNTARNALTSFDNANASTTTTHTNAIRSATTGYNNSILNNDTSNTNTKNSNAAANTNALQSNATSNTNTLASNATAQTNANASNDASKTNTETSNEAIDFANRYQNAASMYNMAVQQRVNKDIYDADIESTISGNFTNAASGVVIGTVMGAIGGGPAGAAVGAAGGLLGAAASTFSTNNVLTSKKEVYDANLHGVVAMTEANNGDTRSTAVGGISVRSDSDGVNKIITQNNIRTNTKIATYSAAIGDANASRTKATSDANANRTKTTADSNANRTKSVSDANADRTKSTADSTALASFTASKDNADLSQYTSFNNSEATKATADANNVRTFDTTNANNQRSLDLAIRNADRTADLANYNINAGLQDAELNNPFQIGNFANDSHLTSKPMGLFVNIKTMSSGDVARTGDHMLRWGYTLNQSWEMKSKQLMKYFTYWKVSDIWLTCCRAGVEDAGEKLEEIFRNGTTVWSDPSKIGKVSIYDNWRQ